MPPQALTTYTTLRLVPIVTYNSICYRVTSVYIIIICLDQEGLNNLRHVGLGMYRRITGSHSKGRAIRYQVIELIYPEQSGGT